MVERYYRVLTKAQTARLDKKPAVKSVAKIPAHERVVRKRRSKGDQKLKLIDDFTQKYLRLCEDDDVTYDDVRAIIQLCMLLDDFVLGHQRGPSQWRFTQDKPALKLA